MRIPGLLLLFLGFCHVALAQSRPSLILPPEYQAAYRNQTRSPDGRPGKKYWQNHAEYNLKAVVDPSNRLLQGSGEITYYNNSPDTLDSLVISLGTEDLLNGAPGEELRSPGIQNGIFNIGKIRIGNNDIDTGNGKVVHRNGQQLIIRFSNPLPSASSVTLKMDWVLSLSPGGGSDMAGKGNTLFFGHWFPEINVYDDIFGWNMNDTDGGGSYHDYSDYRVEIRAPDNFLIWASAPPENPGEIYPDYILKRLDKVNDKETTPIVTGEDIRNGIKVKSRIWKYEASEFPGFSFALSDRFIWAARQFVNGDTYVLNTVCPEANKRFYVNLDAAAEALGIFTRSMPGYPFPFKYFTDFNGLDQGSTGFPGMIVTSFEDSTKYGVQVTALEANRGITYREMIGMYFPFCAGINDTRYGWMDKGWQSFMVYMTPSPLGITPFNRYGRPSVRPMIVPQVVESRESRENTRTSAAYSYYSLRLLLSEHIFTKCLQEYLKRWDHRHPVPFDFFNTFNGVSGRDLTWYWKKWYFDWGYPDLGVQACDGKTITVANMGGRPLAFYMNLYYYDSPKKVVEINPSVWKDNFSISIPIDKDKILMRAEIQVPFSGDLITKNNLWKTR